MRSIPPLMAVAWLAFSSSVVLAADQTVPGSGAPTARARSAMAPRLDLNAAAISELIKLPGVNEATARRIIASRPYKSIAELSRAGLTPETLAKIAPLVSVGPAAQVNHAAPPPTVSSPVTVEVPKDSVKIIPVPAGTVKTIPGGTVQPIPVPAGTFKQLPSPTIPGSGGPPEHTTPVASPAPLPNPAPVLNRDPALTTVWVDTDAKLFYREGTPEFGKTKRGRFLKESQALALGYREAKKK